MRQRRDREPRIKVQNSLNSHLLGSELCASFRVHKPTAGFFFTRDNSLVSRLRRKNKRITNPHKKINNENTAECLLCSPCSCPGSHSVGWLCPSRCKSLRSRLKRVDPPTPACMAALFFIPPIHWHGDAIGAEYSALHTVQ